MSNKSPLNHGEGDPEAADRFNTAEREFVNSERGKMKIMEGSQRSKLRVALPSYIGVIRFSITGFRTIRSLLFIELAGVFAEPSISAAGTMPCRS